MTNLRFERLLTLIIAIIIAGCSALRDVRLSIPAAIQRGDRAVFVCHYDLEGEALYSVKWYKGRREFYRFTPREIPSVKIFPITGLDVDTLRSNGSHLSLESVDLSVSGVYSCEVSADAPSFHTFLVNGYTNVVQIPRHTPNITGIKPKYRLGDTLRGNCTSSDSNPAANLTWFINDEQAPSKYVKPLRKIRTDYTLESSYLGLRFIINKHHFEHGRLKIRCIASIYNVYWQSTEKSIEEEKPKLTHSNFITPNTLSVNLKLPYPPSSTSKYDQYYPTDTFGANTNVVSPNQVGDELSASASVARFSPTMCFLVILTILLEATSLC